MTHLLITGHFEVITGYTKQITNHSNIWIPKNRETTKVTNNSVGKNKDYLCIINVYKDPMSYYKIT